MLKITELGFCLAFPWPDPGLSLRLNCDQTCSNICMATDPLSINLPNEDIVCSMHLCNIFIQGLAMILMGHIVLGLSMASFMGIRVLCKVGCKDIFTNTKCEVKYQKKVIFLGTKDPATNLWTLPITPTAIKLTGRHMLGKDLIDQKKPNPH
jgi:hypothetical protein